MLPNKLLGLLSISLGTILLGGCPSVDVDPGEGVDDTPARGPTVEFDPAKSILPFPNDLARSPDGKKIALPAQACESASGAAIRMGVLNTLDGFGTYQAAMSVTMTEAFDMASAAANVKMYKKSGIGVVTEVQNLIMLPSVSVRYVDPTNCAAPSLVPSLVLVSPAPLTQNTTYDVAILDGLKASTGAAFGPDATWVLARSVAAPVVFEGDVVVQNNTPLDPTDAAQLAQLQSLGFLWNTLQPMFNVLDSQGQKRDRLLVAFEFTTATVTSPIDPAVAGSIANQLPTTGFLGFAFPAPSITQAGLGEAFLNAVLPAGTCSALPCNAVADVLGAKFASVQYQTPQPNPLVGGKPVPGAWSDPVKPVAPATPIDPLLDTLVVVPKCTMPANGWPTVIFGHGLGSSKESLLVFGPQLAAAGFASVAIDFVAHGSRAVQTSDSPLLACSGTPSPTAAPQCFGLFLSTDLAGTRDNIRQTVLDLQRLSLALSACNAGTGCAGPDSIAFKVDSSKIVYAGISLGGIVGTTFTSLSPIVKAEVLNVPGVGLLDILENTAEVQIRCSLVNALIDAKILTGDKWNPSSPTAGLCVAADQGWKKQPGYLQFSGIARWVLDPADGANYVQRLLTKRFLIQKVVNDEVVPNIATDREALLLGMPTAAAADAQVSGTPAPSAAITTNPQANKFVQYTTLPADAGTGFPGNTFSHASLLRPAGAGVAGQLGTLRLQTDAITFLFLNK
ncbi:MAG: hypothetical protein NT062_33950 [Proteobacteria bacterium]|nr:hypothetical protein [Pseudomonadota bacterium]